MVSGENDVTEDVTEDVNLGGGGDHFDRRTIVYSL